MLVTFPSDDEEAAAKRFQTYLTYVRAGAQFAADVRTDPVVALNLKAVVESREWAALTPNAAADVPKVTSLCRSAWLTEMALSVVVDQMAEVAACFAHWTPAQTYYSVFHMVRAWLLASGAGDPFQHASTAHRFGEHVRDRPGLWPVPWRVVCADDPVRAEPELSGLPPSTVVKWESNLKRFTPDRAPGALGLALKTTRRDDFKAMTLAWKKANKRKAIRKPESAALLARMRPTTLLHVLKRMRERANYRDPDALLLGVVRDADAVAFNDGLLTILTSGMATLELLLSRSLGAETFGNIVANFVDADRSGRAANLVGRRWHLVRQLPA